MQHINVDAGIVCVQVALPHMREKGWGRIINIASVTAYGGWALLSPYVQSKGALIGLSRAGHASSVPMALPSMQSLRVLFQQMPRKSTPTRKAIRNSCLSVRLLSVADRRGILPRL